jgi:hypothetical protein
MIRVECPECGYSARVTRKWLEDGDLPAGRKGPKPK